jgi:hypothetical protein
VVRVNAASALARIGAFGLPGATIESINADHFLALASLAESQRMLPWLSAAVAEGQVENLLLEDTDHLRQRTLLAIQSTLAAHSAAASIVSRLKDAGVTDVRVLKGCATGYLDYSPHGHRFSSDVDLLIRSADYGAVLSVFPDSNIPAPRRVNWQRRYGKATTIKDGSGVELDIHTTLSPGYFGLVLPVPELMALSEPFKIGGVEMLALDGPGRLLHAANHAGGPGFIGMHSARDVLQLVLVSEVDWQESIDRATRWRVDGLFARGVVKSWERFDIVGHPLLDWALGHRLVGRQRLAFSLVGGRPRGHNFTAPLALPPQRWPGYVLPLAFPSREYLKENGKTWGARSRQIVDELLGRA